MTSTILKTTSQKIKNNLIVVVGPTGIGKTTMAIKLAQQFETEIISADSRQFYRELKIGTAAPTTDELAAAPHHLIGNISIHDYYNVFMFETDALRISSELFQTKQNAIVVGGSGLYIDALCNGIDDIPDVDEKTRNDLVARFEREGIDGIRFDLKRLDPESYAQVDLKNPKRILRAVEVTLSTGKPYSSFRTNQKKKRPFEITKIALNMNRQELYNRIDTRVDQMISEGLVEEVRSVYEFRKLNALNTVGYKELFEHFDGNYDLDRAIELIKRNSRRYAKRQLSWFTRDKSTHWFQPDEINKIIDLINQH